MNEKSEPTTFKYVGAWIIAAFLSNMLQKVSDVILSNMLIKDLNDLTVYFIMQSLASIIMFSGSFIVIYNLFNSLNVKKVMIYIYTIGGFGTILNLFVTTQSYSSLSLKINLNIYYLSSITAFLVSVYIIRSYFIKNPDRWY